MSKPLTQKHIEKKKNLTLSDKLDSIQNCLVQIKSLFKLLSDGDKLMTISMLEKLNQEASDMADEILRMAEDTQRQM